MAPKRGGDHERVPAAASLGEGLVSRFRSPLYRQRVGRPRFRAPPGALITEGPRTVGRVTLGMRGLVLGLVLPFSHK